MAVNTSHGDFVIVLKQCSFLSAQTQSLYYGAVAFYVAVVQIVEQGTSLADKHCQRTCCDVVLVVLLEVLRQVCDAVCEERYLALCRTRIGVRLAVLAEKLLLFLSC